MPRLCLMLLSVLWLASSALAELRWYRLDLGGVPAGWRRVDEKTANGLRTWATTEFLRINRGGVPVDIEANMVWIDTVQGTPVEMRLMQKMGPQPVESTWKFIGKDIEITTTQGGRTNTVRIPAPTEPWLTPQAARSYIAARGDAGADTIEYRTLSPEYGPQALLQTMMRTGETTVQWEGRELSATRWSISTEGLPFTVDVLFSSDWRSLGATMKLPFGDLTETIAGPEVQEMGGGPSPELFVSLFVEPTNELRDAHHLNRLVLRLSSKDGTWVDIDSAGAQAIAGRSSGRVTIVVDPHSPLPPTAGERDDPAYREASSLVDASDPTVIELMKQAVMNVRAGPVHHAEAMRDFVRRWIHRKGLATAFASASETAVDRSGDCSEHAVLLAAMLRADAIPSRVATGLVWMDGAGTFGWHMWTQALINGAWIDLDATLPMPYSPGHVLVATSPLSDGWGQADLIRLLALLGNLEIEVVEVRR